MISAMQATAQAQPNIALVKYWGKREPALNLPAVPSLSVTLDSLWTRTRVAFDPDLAEDRFTLNDEAQAGELQKVTACLDLLRERAGVDCRARVESRNNFPTGAGLASSASGFAALVRAADRALELDLPAAELSALARRGSGSAARSIFGGFVEMQTGSESDGEAVACPLLAAADWPLEVVVAITSTDVKPVGSTEGMQLTAATSPYYEAWVAAAAQDIDVARRAVLERDFDALAAVSEHSCLKMHGLMLTAQPGLIYWNGATVECMHRVRELRADGVPVFFTIDAGPQLKALCQPEAAAMVAAALERLPSVRKVLTSRLGEGAQIIGGFQGGLQ